MSRKSNADTAQENYEVFDLWRKGKKLDQLVPYLSRRKSGDVIEHKLNRSRINNELRIGTAIHAHPIVRKELADLDDQLLKAGLREPDVPVCAETDDAGLDSSTSMPPVQGGLSVAGKRRLNELEEENAYLREELKEKNAALKRYGLIDRFLTDTMRLPR